MSQTLPQIVHDQVGAARSRLARTKVLVGLDGFVDTILHVVARRESATHYTRIEKMGEFSKKIGEAAGLSANFEMVTQMVKLGGNGPIMANALCRYAVPVTYVGNLGTPHLHPVFADLARHAKVHSIAEPGYTDAVEFEDGKLMFGKHQSLNDVNWRNLVAHVPEDKLLKIFRQSTLIALVNWTMLTHLTAIWQKVATRIAPKLTGEKRWLFVDLTDPAKRSPEDILTALKQVARFQKFFRVILGMNLRESRQIGNVLGLKEPDELYGPVTQHADAIRSKLKVDTVVIHPTFFAAAANAQGSTHVLGPVTMKPKITTGAGDHFNAGFCLGCLLGLDLAGCLQIGVATSGFYVRNAKSPTLDDLQKFLLTLKNR